MFEMSICGNCFTIVLIVINTCHPLFFQKIMSCWLMFFVLICIYHIKCQSSGWMGSLSTTSDIGIFMPPSNEYIITKLCGKAGQIVDSIGNVVWTNGINNYSNSDYFGGYGGGRSRCLETSCIDTIYIEYDLYAKVDDTIHKLNAIGSNNQIIWGYLPSINSNSTTFSCNPGYCISTLKVKTGTNQGNVFVTGINVDCSMGTISPTQNTHQPTNMPSYFPTITSTTPTIAPTTTPTNSPTDTPTITPTGTPTNSPTNIPTNSPSNTPIITPTIAPTDTPTNLPTFTPTDSAITLEGTSETFNLSGYLV